MKSLVSNNKKCLTFSMLEFVTADIKLPTGFRSDMFFRLSCFRLKTYALLASNFKIKIDI